LGRGGQKFDWNERASLAELRGPYHIHLDALLRFGIFERKLRACGEALGKNNHGAAGADRMRESVDRIRLTREVNDDRHAQQDALGAPAFLRGGLSVCARAHGISLTEPQM